MDFAPFIAASYLLTFALLLWMILAAWWQGRQVERRLRRAQDDASR
jgi:heme exporter protein CcmD